MGRKISIDECAAELGISRRSVRRLITTGALTAYHVGNLPKLVRIDTDDLDKLLKPLVPGHAPSPIKAPAPTSKPRR